MAGRIYNIPVCTEKHDLLAARKQDWALDGVKLVIASKIIPPPPQIHCEGALYRCNSPVIRGIEHFLSLARLKS